jgi:hypothetical protein
LLWQRRDLRFQQGPCPCCCAKHPRGIPTADLSKRSAGNPRSRNRNRSRVGEFSEAVDAVNPFARLRVGKSSQISGAFRLAPENPRFSACKVRKVPLLGLQMRQRPTCVPFTEASKTFTILASELIHIFTGHFALCQTVQAEDMRDIGCGLTRYLHFSGSLRLRPLRRGGSDTAHTARETDFAPCFKRQSAASSLLVPVVRTSSTNKTCAFASGMSPWPPPDVWLPACERRTKRSKAAAGCAQRLGYRNS